MLSKIFFYLLTLFLFVLSVKCQMCTRREIVRRTFRVPYTRTYTESYKTNCWYGGKCYKTRIRSATDYKMVMNSTLETVKYCCDGYIRKDDPTDNGNDEYEYYEVDDTLICKPICMPACQNGKCQNPGVCKCKAGYERDPDNPHACLPVCPDGCQNGICTYPGKCLCNMGYHYNGSTCQPICTYPCINGVCTAPDTCECSSGYRKSERNECVPYCFEGCESGLCVQPETCICNKGYYKSGDNCIPLCDGCSNGTCVSFNVCECDSGYELINGTCEPVCTYSYENCKQITKLDQTSSGDDGYNFTERNFILNDELDTSDDEINDSTSFEGYVDFTPELYDLSEIARRNQTAKPMKNDNGFFWIYVATGVVTVLAIFIVLLVLILNRNALRNAFSSGSYVVKDQSEQSCAQKDGM